MANKNVEDIESILKKYKVGIKDHEWRLFYCSNILNWHCLINNRPCNEVISEIIYNTPDIINHLTNITSSKRKNNYKIGHNGYSDVQNRLKVYNGCLNYNEKNLAIAMYNNRNNKEQIKYLGNILDYEVPLKSKQKGYDGKIDLITTDEKTVKLIELKINNRKKETLLRALLEICTYYQRLEKQLFLENYNIKEKDFELLILIEKGSYADSQASNLANYPYLKKILKLFGQKLNVKISIVNYEHKPMIDLKDAFLHEKQQENKHLITLKNKIIYTTLYT